MRQQAFQDFIQERIGRIIRYASSVQPGYFPEHIHHMRTETKRLRALLRWISEESGEEIKLPRSYRKLYKISGIVRDSQIHLQELFAPGLPDLPMFSIWLARNMAAGIEKWGKTFRADIPDTLKKSLDEIPERKLESEALLDYFRKKQAAIGIVLKSDPDDEALHQVRKSAKDLLYILAFCEKHWPEVWNKLQPLEPLLEGVSDRAGAFNDKRNLLDAIQNFREDYKEQLQDADRNAVEKAVQRWTLQKEQARKRLMTALRALIRRRILRA